MNNISEDESEIQVYRCMLCGTQYKEMPQNKFCKVCGRPLNSRQTKISYNKIENGILIKISDEAALKSMNAGQFWFQSPRYYQEFSRPAGAAGAHPPRWRLPLLPALPAPDRKSVV